MAKNNAKAVISKAVVSKAVVSKPVVILARIVPLALVKKRLAVAQDATDRFQSDRDGQAWNKTDAQENWRLQATEAKARIDLSNRRLQDSRRRNGRATA
jgi:hypothetical protein